MITREVLTGGRCRRTGSILLIHRARKHEANDESKQDPDYREKKVLSVHLLCRRALRIDVMHHQLYLVPKFGAVCVAVHRDRVIRSGLKHFFFRAFNAQTTTLIAGVQSAIYDLALRHNTISFSRLVSFR